MSKQFVFYILTMVDSRPPRSMGRSFEYTIIDQSADVPDFVLGKNTGPRYVVFKLKTPIEAIRDESVLMLRHKAMTQGRKVFPEKGDKVDIPVLYPVTGHQVRVNGTFDNSEEAKIAINKYKLIRSMQDE